MGRLVSLRVFPFRELIAIKTCDCPEEPLASLSGENYL